MLQQMEQQKFNALAASHKDEIMNLRRSRDREGLATLHERLIQQAQQEVKEKHRCLSNEMYQNVCKKPAVPLSLTASILYLEK